MNDLYERLKSEFLDEDYRYAYAESFLNTKVATQIKTLREQRDKTQAEVADRIGIKQPGYRRFEDINHSVWKTDSLWAIARAYGVRLNISFESFGSLLEEKKRFSKKALQVPDFEHDPVFKESAPEPRQPASIPSHERIASELQNRVALRALSPEGTEQQVIGIPGEEFIPPVIDTQDGLELRPHNMIIQNLGVAKTASAGV